jgi:flagellar motor switch protein FliN
VSAPSHEETTPAEALMRLAASSAEAVAQVLDMYAPGLAQRGQVQVLPDSSEAFANLPFGAIAASVAYVDGVTGANVFVMPPNGARALAIAMGVPPEDGAEPEDGKPLELTELELSAVSEASNQMMAAAASAIGVVLGQEVNISPPDTGVMDDAEAAANRFGTAPHATSASFTIEGEICRLIQLVPSAFVVRMVRAMDELEDAKHDGDQPGADAGASEQDARAYEGVGLVDALANVHVRVWAELGRTKIPLGRALELPLGAVVDLDCATDAPVDLYVNGLRFAQGQLLVTDEGEWAVSLDDLGGNGSPATPVSAAQPQLKGALT